MAQKISGSEKEKTLHELKDRYFAAYKPAL